MSFFEDVKDFFGAGESDKAETGLAEAAQRTGDNAQARASMGDVHSYVAGDVEVVRSQQDLQTAKTQLKTTTQTRDQKKQALKANLTKAKQADYAWRQRAQFVEGGDNPNTAKIMDLESKLQIFSFNQWSADVTTAEQSVKRMQKKVAESKREARNRYRQAVGR